MKNNEHANNSLAVEATGKSRNNWIFKELFDD
jgi:hypothetical protein